MLERLTDDDIRKIITQAVDRVSTTPSGAGATNADIDDEIEDIPSSQPEEDPLPSPPSSLPPTAPAPTPTQSPPLFPSYPHLTPALLDSMVSLSSGDARTALSLLELVLSAPPTRAPGALLADLRRSVATAYDRTGEAHYDMISALHKSVRGGRASAALYWLARMLEAGEDPLYVARRMVVCASEDVGLADSRALPLVRFFVCSCLSVGLAEMYLGVCLIGDGGVPGVPGDRHARVSHQPRPPRLLPRGGTKVDACIRGLQARGGCREGGPHRACAAARAQCTDEADEGARVRAWVLL